MASFDIRVVVLLFSLSIVTAAAYTTAAEAPKAMSPGAMAPVAEEPFHVNLDTFDNMDVVVATMSPVSEFLFNDSPGTLSVADFSIPTGEQQAKDKTYLEAQMMAAVDKTEKFLAEVEAKMPNVVGGDALAQDCLSQCKEVYESAVDALKKALEDVATGDFYKANVDVSAYGTYIDTCEECAGMLQETPEFKKFDNWARGVTGDCLDKIVQYNANALIN